MSYFGLNREQFLDLTPREFNDALKAYNNQQLISYAKMANLIRHQTVLLINSELPANKQYKYPDRIWTFPWESKREFKQLDEETWEMLDDEHVTLDSSVG